MKLSRTRSLGALPVFPLLLAVPSALAPPAAASPAPARLAGDSAALSRALAAVDPEAICADIRFIASDELQGRDTPSEGLRVAARYLRARLQRLGFAHGAPQGYFYEWPLESHQIDEAGTRVELEHEGAKATLAWARDYFFPSRDSAPLEVRGGVVFCGSGDRAALRDLELEGRWALCVDDGTGSARARERAAREAGAVGIVYLPAPEGESYSERFARDVESARAPRYRYAGARRGNRVVFPDLYLVPPVQGEGPVARLFELALAEPAPRVGASLPFELADVRSTGGEGGEVTVENVCGYWPGSDPRLSKEVIVVTAHYDHVGVSSRSGEIYNGADDNGSGTCGMLALAEALAAHGPLRRSVLLMWVAGEEKGLWGSDAWTRNPWLPDGAKAVCNINIDMIGRNAPDQLLITPTRALKEYNGLTRLAEKAAPEEGFPKLGSADAYWQRSDQVNFAQNLGIPVAFLFSDVHEDYHQPTDDADKIDCDKVARVTRLVMRMLAGLQDDELRL